ncbi:MAG: hypothetical protein NC543_00390 [bacterium]|nr:hypothetical protein [bacterium]MCM1375969.1 hypothetical protein [Muribaculum sp.]
MKINTGVARTNLTDRRIPRVGSTAGRVDNSDRITTGNALFREKLEEEARKTDGQAMRENTSEMPTGRSEASLVCETACKGENKASLTSIRTAPKVPYGHLAKDGVIVYNGVTFTCDEKTNSICLGDTSDKKNTINIPLSGGGHLKVNRANLGQLSKAIGMFSPEDVNRILRAIHLDTKVQSVQKEVEDLEAGVGEEIAEGNTDSAADTKDKSQ